MNEAVRPLNKQDLDGNRTKENTVYPRARALSRFNAAVKEQRSGPRVCIRTPAEAEVDGQASKEAEVKMSADVWTPESECEMTFP